MRTRKLVVLILCLFLLSGSIVRADDSTVDEDAARSWWNPATFYSTLVVSITLWLNDPSQPADGMYYWVPYYENN